MLELPAGHSKSELELARRLARQLGCRDLHVFWSERPGNVSAPAQQLPVLGHGLARSAGFALSATAAVVGALASALGSRRTRA